MRGAITASSTDIRKSTRLEITCSMALRILLEPPEPVATIRRSGTNSRDGAIMEEIRRLVGHR